MASRNSAASASPCPAQPRPVAASSTRWPVLHSFWFEEGGARIRCGPRGRSELRHGPLGTRAQCLGQSVRRGPVGRCPAESRRRGRAGVGQAGPERTGAGLHRGDRGALSRRRGTRMPCGYRPTPTPWPGSTGIIPSDTEVTIYYALALLATAPRTDTTFAQQKRAIAILDPLYDRYPDHPGLAHYIIHSTDSPRLASLGLAAARRYAEYRSRCAACAAHAIAHLRATGPLGRDGGHQLEVLQLRYGSCQGRRVPGLRPAKGCTHWTTRSTAISSGGRTPLHERGSRRPDGSRIPRQQTRWSASTTAPPWPPGFRSSWATGPPPPPSLLPLPAGAL